MMTWLRSALPILAIVGILLTPFTAPVNGAAVLSMSIAGTSDHVGVVDDQMTDDMACCPDEQPPTGSDCPKAACPPMKSCAAKCYSGVTMAADSAIVFATVVRERIRLGAQSGRELLTLEPAGQPPKS